MKNGLGCTSNQMTIITERGKENSNSQYVTDVAMTFIIFNDGKMHNKKLKKKRNKKMRMKHGKSMKRSAHCTHLYDCRHLNW